MSTSSNTVVMDQVAAKVKHELFSSGFGCDGLVPLSGGNANFVFRGHLANPLPDGTREVLIKHGEAYVRTNDAFSLPTTRCLVEAESLAVFSQLPTPDQADDSWFTVRTPSLHHFNPETNTQVQEYLASGIDLKSYALKHYEPHTSQAKRPQCLALGCSLGRWLKSFHAWTSVASPSSASAAQSSLRQTAIANKSLQQLKHSTYYDYLVQLVDKFPAVLAKSKPVFEQVQAMADGEFEDDSLLSVVHGDFWTGNVLLPDKEFQVDGNGADSETTTVFVVDWEVLSLGVKVRDVGQMIAELYMLKLFKGIDAGEWMVEGFLDAYGPLPSVGDAFRTAIHIGCHLVVIGGTVAGWGEKEPDVERVISYGRDMIVKGWERDRDWFDSQGGVLARMMNCS